MQGQERFLEELDEIQKYCREVEENLDSGGGSVQILEEVCRSLSRRIGRLYCVVEELSDNENRGVLSSENIDSVDKPLFDFIHNFRRKNVYYDLLIFDEAIRDLKRVLAENCDPHVIAAAYNGLGHIYATRKMYPPAIYYFTKVIEFYPDNSDGYFNLGAAWFNQGSFEEAIKYLKLAIFHHPDDWEAYFHLGRAYEHMGDYDSAIQHIQKARELKYVRVDAKKNTG